MRKASEQNYLDPEGFNFLSFLSALVGVPIAVLMLLLVQPVVHMNELSYLVSEWGLNQYKNTSWWLNSSKSLYVVPFASIYFLVCLPFSLASGLVCAFTNGFRIGKHGIRYGLMAPFLVFDSEEQLDACVDYALQLSINRFDVLRGNEASILAWFIPIVVTPIAFGIIAALSVAFFPPATHMVASIVNSTSLPIGTMSVLSGLVVSGVALLIAVGSELGALLFGLISLQLRPSLGSNNAAPPSEYYPLKSEINHDTYESSGNAYAIRALWGTLPGKTFKALMPAFKTQYKVSDFNMDGS